MNKMEEIILNYYSSKITVPITSTLDEIHKSILKAFPSIKSKDEIDLYYFENNDQIIIDDQNSLDFFSPQKTPCYVINKAYEQEMSHPKNSIEQRINTIQDKFIDQLTSKSTHQSNNQLIQNIKSNYFQFQTFQQFFNNNFLKIFSPVLQLSTVKEKPSDEIIHEGTLCNICKIEPIKGIMYLCQTCGKTPPFMVCIDCEIRYRHNNCYHPHDLTLITQPLEVQLPEINQKLRSSSSLTQSTIQFSNNPKGEQVINHIYNPSNPLKGFKVKINIPPEIETQALNLSSNTNSPNHINDTTIKFNIDPKKDINTKKEIEVTFISTKIKQMFPGRYIYLLSVKKNKKIFENIKVILNINLQSELVIND